MALDQRSTTGRPMLEPSRALQVDTNRACGKITLSVQNDQYEASELLACAWSSRDCKDGGENERAVLPL